MTGTIIKAISSFYYVLREDGTVTECRAIGKFRSQGISPVVGDRVEIEMHEKGYATLKAVLPRKNCLVRPVVANIDTLVIVIAATNPPPDFILVDKLIISAKLNHIDPVLVVNKIDAADEQQLSMIRQDYASFPLFFVSAQDGTGIDCLRERIASGISCFSGQSAVGKTSLMNCFFPEENMETGALSRKTGRGRHTTRQVTLIPFGRGALLDTPGFSLCDIQYVDQWMIDGCYPEIASCGEKCRFSDCSHQSEPDCAVREMVESGTMTKSRYERYSAIIKEMKTRRNQYHGNN